MLYCTRDQKFGPGPGKNNKAAQTVAEWNAETYGGTVAHWEAFLAQQAAK
jgi:hypothetical protein